MGGDILSGLVLKFGCQFVELLRSRGFRCFSRIDFPAYRENTNFLGGDVPIKFYLKLFGEIFAYLRRDTFFRRFQIFSVVVARSGCNLFLREIFRSRIERPNGRFVKIGVLTRKIVLGQRNFSRSDFWGCSRFRCRNSRPGYRLFFCGNKIRFCLSGNFFKSCLAFCR